MTAAVYIYSTIMIYDKSICIHLPVILHSDVRFLSKCQAIEPVGEQ